MLGDSSVPCAVRNSHVVVNEPEIMRSIESHLYLNDDSAPPAVHTALPSVLLNICNGAVGSIQDLQLWRSAQLASQKLKCAVGALESMQALLTSRHSYLNDRILEGAFSGLLHIQREEMARRTELMLDLNEVLAKRLRNNQLMPSLCASERDSLLLSLSAAVTISQGIGAIEYVRNTTRVRLDLIRKSPLRDFEKIFKECVWLRNAFPSDALLWTESSCARILQDVEGQVYEIGGILEFCRMSTEVLNREEDLLKLRQQLLDEHNDVTRRAQDSIVAAQSMTMDLATASATALLERCSFAESRCNQLLLNQKFRALLLRNAQGDYTNLMCDTCSRQVPADWVLFRCGHKFCSACWDIPNAASPLNARVCPCCHMQLSHHDVFESCHYKTGIELGCFELVNWTDGHALSRITVDWPRLENKELIRLSSQGHCSDAAIPSPAGLRVNAIHLRPSSSHNGTRLAVCIRRIRFIQEQSNGYDKVVVASFSFANSPLKDALVHALKQESISAVCVSGPQAQQADAIRRFDGDMDIQVLLLDMHSSYSGVTLTAANHLFLLDPFPNLPETQQIIARISRQGQRKRCFVYHMCAAGTVEEAILVKRERPAHAAPLLTDETDASAHSSPCASNHASPPPIPASSVIVAAAVEPQVAPLSLEAELANTGPTKRPRSPLPPASPMSLHDDVPSPLMARTEVDKTFAEQLRDAGLSKSDAELDNLVSLASHKGVYSMDDFYNLNEAEVRVSVAAMLLTPVQMNKLLRKLGLL